MQIAKPDNVNQRNYNNNRGYQGQSSGNLAYLPNNRNHLNLSYGKSNNALMPPPGFSITNGVIDPPKMVIAEEVLAHYMKADNTRSSKLETDVSGVMRRMVNHEKLTMQIQTQLAKMAQQLRALHKSGQFPSYTIVNPKD